MWTRMDPDPVFRHGDSNKRGQSGRFSRCSLVRSRAEKWPGRTPLPCSRDSGSFEWLSRQLTRPSTSTGNRRSSHPYIQELKIGRGEIGGYCGSAIGSGLLLIEQQRFQVHGHGSAGFPLTIFMTSWTRRLLSIPDP
jgi:hypothetical protein